jgi:hypothetical protein
VHIDWRAKRPRVRTPSRASHKVASLLKQRRDLRNPVLFPIIMGAIGIIARTLSPRAALIVGALASGLGMVLLILAVRSRDLLIYLLATAAAGGAHRLLFVGGLQVSSAAAYCRPSIFWVIYRWACLPLR